MIQEQYVSYEVAKLLKEKGFQINPKLDYWKIGSDGTMYFMSSIGAYTSDKNNKYAYYRPADSYPAPTQQMAMRWLREAYKIHLDIGITSTEDPINYPPKYYVYVDSISTGESLIQYGSVANDLTISNGNGPKLFSTYEDACEAAIKYCLKNLIK